MCLYLVMSPGKVVTFHPFSFDLELGRLTTRGHPVHIAEQNVRLLFFLIQKSGGLATREELREFLWPDGAPFDAQQAINKAVSQLRTALRDDPAAPRYIETVPRRGYRFCAEIKLPPAPELLDPPQQPQTLELHAPEPSLQVYPSAPVLVARSGSRPWVRNTPRLIVALLALTVTPLLVWRLTRAPRHLVAGAAPVLSIAVAPLEPDGPEATRLAESFRLDLVDSLSQLPGLKVLSAHAFATAPRDSGDVMRMASRQGTDLLLLGKFRVKNDLCLMDLELVHTADFAHLATFHYQGSPMQFRSILSRAQQDIFTRLHLDAAAGAPARGAAAPAAYEAYLEGRRDLAERTDHSLNAAVAQFKLSVTIDPKFARAYGGMASAYMILAAHDSFPDGYQMARGLAMHALQLDPSLAEAHAILGCIAMTKDWDPAAAERELGRAIELDPDEASYHLWAATMYNFEGRFTESLHQIDLAREEDPYWPPVYETEVGVAANAGAKRRLGAAAEHLLRLTPAWPLAYRQVGASYWIAGRYADAIAAWRALAVLEHSPQAVRQEDAGLNAFRLHGPQGYASLRLLWMDRAPRQERRL